MVATTVPSVRGNQPHTVTETHPVENDSNADHWQKGMIMAQRILPRRLPGIEHGRWRRCARSPFIRRTRPRRRRPSMPTAPVATAPTFSSTSRARSIRQRACRPYVSTLGRRIKSKCLEVYRGACTDVAALQLLALGWSARIAAIDAHERGKAYPNRYPVNL